MSLPPERRLTRSKLSPHLLLRLLLHPLRTKRLRKLLNRSTARPLLPPLLPSRLSLLRSPLDRRPRRILFPRSFDPRPRHLHRQTFSNPLRPSHSKLSPTSSQSTPLSSLPALPPSRLRLQPRKRSTRPRRRPKASCRGSTSSRKRALSPHPLRRPGEEVSTGRLPD
jgi:hypothetical protein